MKQPVEFVGVALGGRKCSGKDTVLEHLQRTRANIEVVRCKQPIVDEYLRLRNKKLWDLTGYPLPPRDMSRPDDEYVKQRDDADLIWFSSKVIRDPEIGDPHICSKYLLQHIPRVVDAGRIPVIPDMRRFEENNTIFIDLGKTGYPLLCMKLEVDEDVLKERLIARDGDLRNWHPYDDTESEIDALRYHYYLDNNRNELRPLVMQLEAVLPRYHRLKRTSLPTDLLPTQVRVIDPSEANFWKTGEIVERLNGTAVVLIENEQYFYVPSQLVEANGGCF